MQIAIRSGNGIGIGINVYRCVWNRIIVLVKFLSIWKSFERRGLFREDFQKRAIISSQKGTFQVFRNSLGNYFVRFAEAMVKSSRRICKCNNCNIWRVAIYYAASYRSSANYWHKHFQQLWRDIDTEMVSFSRLSMDVDSRITASMCRSETKFLQTIVMYWTRQAQLWRFRKFFSI